VHTDPEQAVRPGAGAACRTSSSTPCRPGTTGCWAHLDDRGELAPEFTEGTTALRRYLPLIPAAYKEDFNAVEAAEDLTRLETLSE